MISLHHLVRGNANSAGAGTITPEQTLSSSSTSVPSSKLLKEELSKKVTAETGKGLISNSDLIKLNALPAQTDLNSELAKRVQVTDVVDSLSSTETSKPLSAKQGSVLNDSKEDKSNKKTDITSNKSSDIFYPSVKAVADWSENSFVKKDGAKGLSTNDFTTTEKNKIANVPADTNSGLSKKADKLLTDLSEAGTVDVLGTTDNVISAFGKIKKWYSTYFDGFNTANKLLLVGSDGKLPSLDGSKLTNVVNSFFIVSPLIPLMTGETTNGVKVTCSSYFSDDYSCWKASGGGQWATKNVVSNYWIAVNFGVKKTITSVVAKSRGGEHPANATIQVSHDGTAWTDVGGYPGEIQDTPIYIPVLCSTQHVRVFFASASSNSVNPGLSLLQILGY